MMDPQLKAIETIEKNVAVNAGAGTGKTKVLTERFVYILEHGDLELNKEVESIVAITFTKKATQEMVESYEKADGTKMNWTPYHTVQSVRPPYEELEPRFEATIIYPGSSWKGNIMQNSVNGTYGTFMAYRAQPYTYGHTTTGYFLRKLMDESLVDIKGKPSTQPWIEIRYSEVLLNKAEAAYRLNKIEDARNAMNAVRNRVNLPPKSSSGNEWFEDYKNERKVELAYEGQLFWDMRRWKIAHIEYNNYRCHGFKITGDEYEYIDVDYQDRKFLEKTYILPIPDNELANNSLIEQYDDWK